MPPYNVEYRSEVYGEDFRKIPRNLQKRILRAIENRLMTKPTGYGVRLSQTLTGLWKMRVGDYRIVFEIHGHDVTVWAIRHRKDVYEEAERRWILE
jgi:mRNA interferase RelE/StbE